MAIYLSDPVKIIVVGGGYAGLMAAVGLAGKTKDADVQITLINGLDHFVERIRLHQFAAKQQIARRPLHQFLAGTGVDFQQGWVSAIEPKQKRVIVQTGGGQTGIDYDYLIYAVGSTVDVHSVPGVAEYAYSLGGKAAATQLRAQLPAVAAEHGHLLVVGGGLTGIEAATEIAETYPDLQVTLATRGRMGETLSQRGAAYMRKVFAQMGIQVEENIQIDAIEARQARTQDGRTIPFDLCLWAGAFAVPPLARQSGLPTNARGQILVDDYLRSIAYPEIYAAGDAAATPLRLACATAMPMGAYVARHLAAVLTGGSEIAPFRFGYVLQCISLGRRRGLVQFVDDSDIPQERVITGLPGAFVKESICRYTVWSIHLEKRLPGSYIWPQRDLSRRLAPAMRANVALHGSKE